MGYVSSNGDKKTNAGFYIADVDGFAICRLPTSCELQLVEMQCGIHAIKDALPYN